MHLLTRQRTVPVRLNESPSEKEGKSVVQRRTVALMVLASMKVPPKRKGN